MLFGNMQSSKKIYSLMTRSFGGSAQHFKKREFFKRSENVIYKEPVEEADIDQELGKSRGLMTHNIIIAKLNYLLGTHRVHFMDNARTNKYSAYHWIPKIPLLRNSLVLKTLSSLFDNSRQTSSNLYDEPVRIHENSIFLYQSPSTPTWIGNRITDYAALGCLVYGTMIATYPLMWLPALIYGTEVPRIYMWCKLVTHRADLLPHTEQVVFTKIGLFGSLRRVVVDVKNLSKVNADSVPDAGRMFRRNDLDSRFVWKDNESGEYFLFVNDGVWSEEGISHPLIN